MRVNILLGILVIAVGILTCKNLQKTKAPEAATVAAPAPAPQEKTLGMPASHVFDTERPDTVQGAMQIHQPPKMVNVPIDKFPPASASKRAYLSTGWWHLSMAYQPSDTTIHNNYQPKWLHFREDQTFDVVIKGKVVDTGRWNFDQEHMEILLSCHDPYINNSWAVQEKGFVMIWKGNTSLNVTGIQVRVIGQRTEPVWQ